MSQTPIKSYIHWQGDVIFEPIATLPKGARKLPHTNVAEGEVLGHHHHLENYASVYEYEGVRYAQVEQDTIVTHDEHGWSKIPAGLYKIDIQQELTFENQLVAVRD